MKKILHIITRLDTGGSAENVILTCELLGKREYETYLVSGFSKDFYSSAGVYVILIRNLCREISLLRDFFAFLELLRVMKQTRPDIVHTHSSKAGILGRWAAYFYKKTVHGGLRIIHTPHGHVFYGYSGKIKSLFYVYIERLSSLITDTLVALTCGERDESLYFGVGKPGQWTVIHSGVESAEEYYKEKSWPSLLDKIGSSRVLRRKEFRIPEDGMVIGTVARLEPVKGVRYFVEAAFRLKLAMPAERFKNIFFFIAGDGSERKLLEKEASDKGLPDRVIFAGVQDKVMEVMCVMDIYVQPSVNEGMGKTIIQAMSLGLPVIATNVQGIPSVIEHGRTGLLVSSCNAEELSWNMQLMLDDKTFREKLAVSGRADVMSRVDGFPRFGVERMMYLLEILYGAA